MNSLQKELLAGFGDVVDRIVCTPVGGAPVIRRGRGGPVLSRYLWMKVYDETRRRFGRSLTLLAAEALMNKVCEGDPVLILTNSNETDGPPGAAAIARALIVGLRTIPIIISNYEAETKFERCVPETCIGAELLPVYDPEDLKGNIWTPYSVLVQNWPKMSIAQTEKESKRILDLFKPKAVITVEAISCNQKGVLHGALGGAGSSDNPDEEIVRWNQLLDEANARKILTIATGDNGNECGFGTIEDILKKHHVFCADCGCPCGEGIVSASKADIVIPASSSNWACYGIEACLARLLRNLEAMHDERTHERILFNCANAGIPDGASAMCTPTTDGYSHEACIYTVGQLRQAVTMSFKELVRESR